jgi:hypothetical protein
VNASVNPATLTGLLPATQSPLDPSGKTPGGSGGGLLSDGGLLSNLLGGEDGGLLSGGLLGGGDGLLGGGGLLRESTQSSSPTGLSEQQELDLLGQLLGGR